MTCTDKFSKMTQLLPLKESDTCTMAARFLSMVVSMHRLLECITSHRDPHFFGHFWDEFMFILDIILTFIIASHPQTDRIAKVMNCTME